MLVGIKIKKKLRKRFATSLALAACVASIPKVHAQVFSGNNSTVYYDADEINLDKETGNIKAKGNAFILFGNVFISADSFEYNKVTKILLAEGGVRLVRNRERITASRVLINEQTNEARMDSVEIYADPKDTEAQVNEEVLGFSRAEIAFEVARQERTKEILQELNEIRAKYSNIHSLASNLQSKEKLRLTRRYAQLLERLIRTRYQPSEVLRDLPEDARKRLENRREAVRTFATKDPELAKRVAGLQRVPGYLNMKAFRVFQDADQNMDVEKASLTTCRCGPDENPVWGLSASRALVEPNEYITLYGSTLEVSSFPIAYSPWFKMPIKTKRQSGFLLPSFYISRAGDAASFPYYLTLGEHADATTTFTYFSKRGPRLDAELRAALSNESRTTIKGEFLRQKAGVDLNDTGSVKNRWAWGAQTNLPIERRTSLKFDFEKMSDQRYFSDLTKEPGTTQDLFTPQIIVKRFLSQDAALEHSSESFSLGVRVQQPEDVFAASKTSTPARLPRIDLALFPRALGQSGFSWEGQGSFENVIAEKLTDDKPSQPDINGKRASSRLRLNYVVPLNPFLNVRLGSELVHINYDTRSYDGEASFAQADIGADLPIYANVSLNKSTGGNETILRHNVTPFVNLRWIPQVQRSGKYPDIYSTFYTFDNVARSQLLEFGINTDVLISQDEFQATERSDTQSTASGAKPSATANERLFFDILNYQPPASSQEAGQVLFNLTMQSKNSASFERWAVQELETYKKEMIAAESSRTDRFLTVQPIAWRRVSKMNARPIGLGIRSSYNFEAVRTAAEQNRNLLPSQTPVSAAPWGDVVGTLSLSSHPILPLSGSLSRAWQPAWRTFREESANLEISTQVGISASLVRSTVRSEALDGQGQKIYPEEQLWGIDSTYQPKSWIKLQVQYRRNIKPQPAASAELEYSSLQKITFLGIQDCVDITLQRFKDRDIRERLATWTLGLNLNFLGQQRQIESLGKVVDRAIKSQLSKGQNTIPR